MRRHALAVLALTALTAATLGGCSNEPVNTPSAPTAPSSSAAAPTTDPLAMFSVNERSFIRSITAAGFTFNTGNQGAVDLAELICTDIRSGRRPASTQQDLAAGGTLTASDAGQIYTIAQRSFCPEVPVPDPNSFTTGTYEVGVDIQPGRYRSPGGSGCYWARLDSGQDIIDNNLSDGPTVFDVEASDEFVELNRCTWTLAE